MATSKILAFFETIVKPTFTQSSIGAGAGRICSQVDNTSTRADKCYAWWQVKTGGAAPAANTSYRLWLVPFSQDGTVNVPGGSTSAVSLGTSDAAVSTTEPDAADLVGNILLPATAAFTKATRAVCYDLPPKYSFVHWNGTGQTNDTTAGNFELQVLPVNPEAQ